MAVHAVVLRNCIDHDRGFPVIFKTPLVDAHSATQYVAGINFPVDDVGRNGIGGNPNRKGIISFP
jgi:hypothetical protein